MTRGARWRTLLLVALAVPFLYPLVFMAFVAIRPAADYRANPVGLPTSFTWSNLSDAWKSASLASAMINSTVVALTATALTLVLCSTAAFWFAQHNSRAARLVLAVVVTSWLIPFVIYLIPLYSLLSSVSLSNNLVVVAVILAATNIPFGLYLVRGYMLDSIPEEIYEAASIDGAGTLMKFRRIALPLSRPALGALGALVFVWTWGDLLVSVIMLQDQVRWTLPVAVSSLASRQDAAIQQTAAGALIAILPLFVVFIVAQRGIVKGITAGVGK